ncbi:hypothetical protein [Halorarius halobius]|uniref:hypothetical protein n=1 Tax=Halorarius halobius TaxID=2962671 RepID=UPI0020CD4D01|nr:hypothetical protein [Halorarius halobius]
MSVVRRVVDRVVGPETRARLRRDAGNVAADLLVGAVVLLVALAIVVAAALALGSLVLDAGGTLGIVGGWVGMFTLVLLVPLATLKTATALYGRFGR